MRKLTGHKVNDCNNNLEILVLDEPGQGGANHTYAILAPQDIQTNTEDADKGLINSDQIIANRGIIRFQNGPIKEHGVNGVTQEALLEIVADRLRSFNSGPFACKENAVALTHIETAQLWLHKRTIDRQARGVEGTNQK